MSGYTFSFAHHDLLSQLAVVTLTHKETGDQRNRRARWEQHEGLTDGLVAIDADTVLDRSVPQLVEDIAGQRLEDRDSPDSHHVDEPDHRSTELRQINLARQCEDRNDPTARQTVEKKQDQRGNERWLGPQKDSQPGCEA